MRPLGTFQTGLVSRTRCVAMDAGELVFMGREGDEKWHLYICALDFTDGLRKRKMPAPCQHAYNMYFLNVVILHYEYLAISCSTCEQISLVNLSEQRTKVAFRGHKIISLCHGESGKIFATCEDNVIRELDCLRPLFTFTGKQIMSNIPIPAYVSTLYLSGPKKVIIIGGESEAQAISVENDQLLWRLGGEIDNQVIFPRSIIFSPKHGSLLIADQLNKRIIAVDPNNGLT